MQGVFNKMDFGRNIRGRNSALILILALAVFWLGGCASRMEDDFVQSHNPEFDQLRPTTVAVLPFTNMTTSMDATPLIRPVVAERVRYKGYQVKNLEKVDEILHEEGVQIAHDVYAFTPQEFGEMLEVDAVMFGTVVDFTTKYAGVYASVAVQIKLELVDCETGEILWQNEQRAAENTAVESIITMLMYAEEPEKGLAVVAASNALWAIIETYRPYVEKAAAKTLASLPSGPKGETNYYYEPAMDSHDKKAIIYHSVILTNRP
jgi:hypothetical protein